MTDPRPCPSSTAGEHDWEIVEKKVNSALSVCILCGRLKYEWHEIS